MEDLDAFWHRLVPTSYPPGGDLSKRVPVPVFFGTDTASVAVHSAGGIERIPQTILATLGNLEEPVDGLGVVIDADDRGASTRWQAVRNGLRDIRLGTHPGEVVEGPPRAGIFALPDNEREGTLETLLLACAEKAYPALLEKARDFVEELDPSDTRFFTNARDRKDFEKPFGKTKAIAASIAGVLRPGKSIQVSIQDNQWLRHPEAVALPDVENLLSFVDTLLGAET